MVVGGSMGGYVAVLLAATAPPVSSVGLCDGGARSPSRKGSTVDEMLKATLGPSLERLDMTFADIDEYIAFWKQHPAFTDGWNDTLERSSATTCVRRTADGIRSKVNKEAIVADGPRPARQHRRPRLHRGHHVPGLAAARSARTARPAAPLIPERVPLSAWRGDRLPQLDDEMLDDLNHWTLFMGERGAGAIAARVRLLGCRVSLGLFRGSKGSFRYGDDGRPAQLVAASSSTRRATRPTPRS